jgi:hypothetical protein
MSSKKLSLKELEAKRKHHKKRVKFYDKKINNIKSESNRIGFKWYD